MKKFLFGALALFVLYSLFSKSDTAKADEQKSYIKYASSETSSEPSTFNYTEEVERYAANLVTMTRASDRKSKDEILSEINFLNLTASFLNSIPDSINNSLNKKVEKAQLQLKKIQLADFPILRKNFVKWSGEQVWENNIDVQVGGSNYKSITFIAGAFANRANIKKSQETLIDVLTKLRFKEVNYKWYKYDSDYTYYTLDSKDDGEINQ